MVTALLLGFPALPAPAGDGVHGPGFQAAGASAAIAATVVDPTRVLCGRSTGGTISVTRRDRVPPPGGSAAMPHQVQVRCVDYRGPAGGGGAQDAAPDARWAGRMLPPAGPAPAGGTPVIEIITNLE